MTRVLVIGQEAYSPWQQVYSVLRRLPSGICLVSDPETRVGEFARKAAEGVDHLEWDRHDEPYEPVDVDWCILFWDPKDVFGEDYKYFVGDVLYADNIFPLEITPELYPEQAQYAVDLITLWEEHGDGERLFPS